MRLCFAGRVTVILTENEGKRLAHARRPNYLSDTMVRLEFLTADEGLRLREIRLRALRDAPDVFSTTLEEYLSWPEERWTAQLRDLPTFVAVEQGRDVGMVRCAKDTELTSVAWLVSMWVDPSVRSRGIGASLVDRVIEWARQNRIESLRLDVGDDNTPATRLYRSKGFTPNGNVGTMPPPREHIREHQMELRLV